MVTYFYDRGQQGYPIDQEENFTWGLKGSTGPFVLDVSGVPSPFLLFSGLLVRSMECLVSVLLKPSCLPDIWFWLKAGLEAAG